MRLMGQVRGGYYAAAPEAVAEVLDRLLPPEDGECLVLDPCGGDGHALLQLCEGLQAEPYGIELSEDRGSTLRALLSEQALMPADFLRTQLTPRSFSLVWCNPPFDYSTGEEGRVESQFLHKATNLLVEGGLMCFVCPESVARDFRTSEFFESEYENISAMPFPSEVRKYNETIVMGAKRRHHEMVAMRPRRDWLDQQFAKFVVYELPAGNRPRVFKKTEPTDAELMRLVEQSPLRFMIDRPANENASLARPPMSIGVGHRALLLASGHLNGIICPPDEPPHVIRGTAIKETYVSSHEVTEDDHEKTTVRTVISERPQLIITVLDCEGKITILK